MSRGGASATSSRPPSVEAPAERVRIAGAIESDAISLAHVIAEASISERQGRRIDSADGASMERKKREGYF